ncbi:unnamed protein product [Schistosoma turkestanicum]|nr:unnamed protein product [Schistosoma turkestanicum]
MTELSIGAHCSQEDCKQLDFLPIQCEYCDRIFCKIHSSITAHNCPVPNSTYQSSRSIQSQFHSDHEDDDSTNNKLCSYHSCNQRQLVLLSCDACHGNFCISHKQKEIHECSSLAKSNHQSTESQPVKTVDRTALDAISHTIIPKKTTNDTQPVKPLSDHARATKAKLILLKTKMEALPGGQRARELPESERFVVRLSVTPEVLSTCHIISAYFGKNYGLIRLSDELDEFYSTRSNNNNNLHRHETVCNSLLDLSCSLDQHVGENCFVEGQLLQIVSLPQI